MNSTDVKIILLGESGVGKSSLLLRFKTGVFREKLSTTFIDHHVKNIQIKDKCVKLCIWDTAGQEQFRSIVSRGADGVLLVYDVTDVTTFHTLSRWLSDLRHHNEDAIAMIAGNKNDDLNAKSVAVSAVKNYCRDENLEYVEVSAKSGENVEMVFKSLAEKILIAKGILPLPKVAPATPELHSEKLQKPSADTVEKFTPSLVPEQPPHVSLQSQVRISPANDKVVLLHQRSISVPRKKKKCC